MIISMDVHCPFCSVDFLVDVKAGARLRVPARAAIKLHCGRCESTIHLDLNVRRANKSTKLKKREEAFEEALVIAAKQAYAAAPESIGKPWEQLERWEQRNWLGHARVHKLVQKSEW